MPLNFRVSRDSTADLNAEFPVDFLVGGTALFGSDYTVSGCEAFSQTDGRMTIPIGALSADIIIVPIADNLFEADESVIITLLPTAGLSELGLHPLAIGTLLNDDTALANVSIVANGLTGWTISRTGPIFNSLTTICRRNISSNANGLNTQETATIGVGSNSVSVPISQTPGSRIERLDLLTGTGYVVANPNSAAISIVALPIVSISAAIDSWTISRSGAASGSLSINYQILITPESGTTNTVNGTTLILAGSSSVVIPITNSQAKRVETATIVVGSNYAIGNNASASIGVDLIPIASVVAAGNSGWTIARSVGNSNEIVPYDQAIAYQVEVTTNGNNVTTAGVAYILAGNSTTFVAIGPATTTRTEKLTILPGSSYTIGGSAFASIDLIEPATVTIATNGTSGWTISRTGITTQINTVNYNLATAPIIGAPSAVNSTINIPVGSSSVLLAPASLAVSSAQTATLMAGPSYSIGTNASASLNIIVKPTVAISNNGSNWLLSRTGVTTSDLVVDYTILVVPASGGSSTISGQATIPTGASTTVVAPSSANGTRTETLNLAASSNYLNGSPDGMSLTISIVNTVSIFANANNGWIVSRSGSNALALAVNYRRSVTPLGGGTTSNDLIVNLPSGSSSAYIAASTTLGSRSEVATVLTGVNYDLGAPASASISIVADPAVSVAANGNTEWTLSRAGSTTAALTVNCAIEIAIAGGNTTTTAGVAVFAASSSSISIPVSSGTASRSETLTISSGFGYTIGTNGSATISVFVPNQISVAANGNLGWVFTRSGSSNLAVTVAYELEIAPDTGTLTTTNSAIVIPAGSASVSLTAFAVTTTSAEQVTIVSDPGYTVGSGNASIQVVIVPNLAVVHDGNGQWIISRSTSLAAALTVNYSITTTPLNGASSTIAAVGTILAGSSALPIAAGAGTAARTEQLNLLVGVNYALGANASAQIVFSEPSAIAVAATGTTGWEFTRSGSLVGLLSIDYELEIAPDVGVAVISNGQIDIPDGQSTATLLAPTVTTTSTETVTILAGNPFIPALNYTIGTPASAAFSIIVIPNVSVAANGLNGWIVTRSGSTADPLIVNFDRLVTPNGGAGVATSGVVNLLAAQASANVAISNASGTRVEKLTVIAGSGYTIGIPSNVTISIP